MRSGVVALVALCLAPVMVTGATGKNSYELRRSAKVGDSAKYHIDAHFKYNGRSASMSMDQTEKVFKVDTDGAFEVETTASAGQFGLDGHAQAMPESPCELCVYDRLGTLTKINEASDSAAYRKAYMLAFVAPDKQVSQGDKWSKEFKADDSTGTHAARTDFQVETFERVAGITVAKVHFLFSETEGADPISSDGYAWVSTVDGSILKLEAKFKNFPMGSVGVPVQGTFAMKRAD